MRRFLTGLLVFPLVGCLPQAPANQVIGGVCAADGAQQFVGQPESVLKTASFSEPVRIIHPGQPVTMDYNPGRLNIQIDAAGIIARVSCG